MQSKKSGECAERPIPHRAIFWIAILLIFFVAPYRRTLAQSIVGSIGGIVTDATGAVVPDAVVTVSNQGTNIRRNTSTDRGGSFTVAALPPGAYRIRVQANGFEISTIENVKVVSGVNTRLATELKIGSATQTVTVASESQTLQTDSAEVRSDISNKQLSDFPVPSSRNFESALILVPGVTPPLNSGSFAANPSRGLFFSANGAFGNSNNVHIDGAPAVNSWLPNVAAYSPGLEAIDSVDVVTNAYNAQDGLAGGASVNVHIKTGTNAFHGSAFEEYTGNSLTAKPFFLPAAFTQNPKNVENSLGGTLGGPILRNRLFFFFSYDGWFQSETSTLLTTVPTSDMRAGDFSGSTNPIYDPLTGTATGAGKTAFPMNMIPLGRQSTIAQAIQTSIPLPNLPGIANNYFASGPFTVANSKYDTDMTWAASPKLSVEARYGQLHFNVFDAAAFGTNGPAVSSAGGRTGSNFGNVYNGTSSVTYIIGPKFVYNGFYTATLLALQNDPGELNTNIGLNLGIPGTNGPTELYGGWPQFSISNFSTIGNAASQPFIFNDRDNQLNSSFTWTRAAHTVVFGGNVERQILDHADASSGSFTFTGAGTTVAGGPGANAYNSYADFLLGTFATGTTLREFSDLKAKWLQYSVFAQDQWAVSPRLTVSYGLRWDYFPVGGRDHRGYERYNSTNNTMMICGVAGNPHDCGYEVSKLNFSPNLGTSYKVTPTAILLAGAGINRDPYPLTFNRDLLVNFPTDLTATTSAPTSTTTSGTLSTGLPTVLPVDISTGTVPVPSIYQTVSLMNHNKRDYVETWNLGIQNEWKGGLATELRYIGTRVADITSELDSNAGLPGGGAASQPLNAAFGRTAVTYLMVPVGRNQYDAMQAQAIERLGQNLTLHTNFTWSKAFAYCCDRNAGETLAINAPGYLKLNRALARFSQKYVFTLSGSVRLPFGKGQQFLSKGIPAAIAGGWQLSGIQEIYSGLPFAVSASGSSLNAPSSTQVADRVKGGSCIVKGYHGPTASYVDPTCFAAVTTARFGNSGESSVIGPGVKDLNATLERVFTVHENFNLTFRAEVFNVTNTPHFANPSANISSVAFNPDLSVKSLGGFGALSAVNSRDQEGIDQRFIRIGAKVNF